MSIHGTIEDLDNQGTIVQVWVRTDDDRLLPVNFDHRMFQHMADARGLGHLVGAGVTYDDSGEQPTLSFDGQVSRRSR